MVLQNVDSSTLSPTLDPAPSISVMSFEGHRLQDTLKSFPVGVKTGGQIPDSTFGGASGWKSGGDEGSVDITVEASEDSEKAPSSTATPTITTPTTPVAHSNPQRTTHASPTSTSPTTSNAVHHIISIMNHVWLCDSSGFVHVYCALSYQPLLSFPVANSASSKTAAAASVSAANAAKDASAAPSAAKTTSAPSCATQLLFVSAANQVFAALNDGNVVFCNVVAVGQHLPPPEQLEDGAKAEHKWLNQTLMQVRERWNSEVCLCLSSGNVCRRLRMGPRHNKSG